MTSNSTKARAFFPLKKTGDPGPKKDVHPQKPPYDFNKWIDKHAVLSEFPMCERTLYNYRKKGIIPHVLFGNKFLYNRTALEAKLLKMQKGGAAD